MSTPSSNTVTASCLTNLLERQEASNQCPCWCHNGYSPPCYDCAEVVCHKQNYASSSQGMAPSAPPLALALVPDHLQDIIDNFSTNDNNNDSRNVNNNTWQRTPGNDENNVTTQRPRRSGLRPRHPRTAGATSSPLGGSWTLGNSRVNSSRTTVNNNMLPGSRNTLGCINRPGNANKRHSYSIASTVRRPSSMSRPSSMARPSSISSPGSISSISRLGNMGMVNSIDHSDTTRWQDSRISDLPLLPTAIGTTAYDTVSPDAAKWPVSRRTVYPGADVTVLSPSVRGSAHSPADGDQEPPTGPSPSADAIEIADTPDEDLSSGSFQIAGERSGSPSDAERDLSSSSSLQPSAGSSENELSSGIVESSSSPGGDVDTEEEEEGSGLSSEARGRRLMEETLYPTEVTRRTKPFLLWKLNL